jgi:dihydrofolate reductase
MRKLSVNTFLTLDGVMQAPGGPDEDTASGFTLGGWSFHYWDDVMNNIMGGYMGKPFDLLLGRKTYDIFAAFWPKQGDDNPAAAPLNNATKYVASRTLKQVDWQNSHLLGADVVADITRLKEQKGPEIQVHGSGNLIQTLLQADLIDELQIWTFPLVIGKGKRLFAEGTIPAALRVVENNISSTGVVITRYERAGEIKTGSFAD